MRWVIVTGLVVLCACTSRVEQTKKQYEMMKRSNPGASELCAKGRALIDDYLQAGDEQAYQLQKGRIETDCSLASWDEKNGIYHDAKGNIVTADSIDANALDVPDSPVAIEPAKGDEAPQDDPTNPCYKAGPRC